MCFEVEVESLGKKFEISEVFLLTCDFFSVTSAQFIYQCKIIILIYSSTFLSYLFMAVYI